MRSPGGGAPAAALIDRVSADDLMSLTGDTGSTPMHAGAVLLFSSAHPTDVQSLLATLEARLPTVPRLRQRLVSGGRLRLLMKGCR